MTEAMESLLGVGAGLATVMWAAYWTMLLRSHGAPARGRRLLGVGATVILLASLAFAFTLGTTYPMLAVGFFEVALLIVIALGIAKFYLGPR